MSWIVSTDGVFDEEEEGIVLPEDTAPLPPREGPLGLAFPERQGFPSITAMFQGILYYIPEEDAESLRPQVRTWDGATDSEFFRTPSDTLDITSIEIHHMSGVAYLVIQTLDSLTPLVGSVYAVNIATRALVVLGGGPLPEGYLPFSTVVHAGIVVVPTYTNDPAADIAGRLYVTNPTPAQPGYNVWIEGLEATGFGGFTGAQGGMVGVEGPVGVFATAAAIASINTSTGAVTFHNPASASGGAAAAGNAFLSACPFKGITYTSYWNPDSTPISKIYQVGWDGGTNTSLLTQVWEAGGEASLQKPINLLFSPDGQILYALMGGSGTGGLLSTIDGVNWIDRSNTLPADCPPLTKAAGGKITRATPLSP